MKWTEQKFALLKELNNNIKERTKQHEKSIGAHKNWREAFTEIKNAENEVFTLVQKRNEMIYGGN